MAQTPTPALEGLDTRVDIRRWFNEPTAFPDLTVKCGSRSFLVHRVVLCDCSEWFKKALTGGFIESGGNNIQLHEDNEDVVTYMLRYCYNFDILEELLEDELSFVVQVFAAAEKYMLPHLARRCATAFKMLAGGEWANFSFETVIREVYTTTSDVDRVLRNPIVDIIMKHAEVLFREDGSQGLSDVLGDTPEFAADLTKAFGQAKGKRDAAARLEAASYPISVAGRDFARTLNPQAIPPYLRCSACDGLCTDPQILACCVAVICGQCYTALPSTTQVYSICEEPGIKRAGCMPHPQLQSRVKIHLKNTAKKLALDPTTFQPLTRLRNQ